MAKKILVIDDETELAELIKIDLEAKQYEVLVAHDGSSGLKRALAEKPDLVILDIMMPGMDGYEVLRELRNASSTRMLPVIMLSAKSETPSILESQNLGATDYLIKPFDAKEMYECIGRCLGT